MKRAYFLAASSATFATLGVASTAHAALPSIDGKAVIQATCQNHAGEKVSVDRLANMLVISTGYLPQEIMGNSPDARHELSLIAPPTGAEAHLSSYSAFAAAAGDDVAIQALKQKRRAELEDIEKTLRYGIDSLESYLDSDVGPADVEVGAKVIDAPESFERTLFSGGDWQILCDGKIKPPTTYIADVRDTDKHAQFVLRKSIDDFGKNGKDWRKEVGAFSVDLTRTRTLEDDGTYKTAKNFSVNGAIGFRLSPEDATMPSWLYASYSLSKDRVNPPPALDPGKSQSDGDTDALELGVAADASGTLGILNLHLTGSASFIRDFANESSVGKFQYRIRPGIYVPLGVCDLGKYKQIVKGIWTRCSAEIHAEAVHIFKGGEAVFKDVDQYIAAGGMAKIVAFAPTSKKNDGIVGSLSYRHLAVSSHSLKDISRWDASVGYRLWIKDGPGVDVGFSWNKGTNEKSLEKEDILKFGIGLIF